jgi:hypothetical protein
VIGASPFDMLRWLLTASMPLSFGLITIEFGCLPPGFDFMRTVKPEFMSKP